MARFVRLQPANQKLLLLHVTRFQPMRNQESHNQDISLVLCNIIAVIERIYDSHNI